MTKPNSDWQDKSPPHPTREAQLPANQACVTGALNCRVNNNVVDVDLAQDSDVKNSKATNDTKKEKKWL
ncbi:hypothetical protein MJO29_000669 [Puccinia striiformis f. sp. tritici]|nr:hypothetical protein MJO29_000669 [Puccinia striiformis f. sp. tritici]